MIKMMRVSLFQACSGEQGGKRTHGSGCQPSPPGWSIHQMSSTASSNQMYPEELKTGGKVLHHLHLGVEPPAWGAAGGLEKVAGYTWT